jgi:apolipoprotein N-acyltransferase
LRNLSKNHYLKFLYPLLLGTLTSFSLPPYNYFIINFFTFSLFFIFIINQKENTKKNFFYFKLGWFFGFGYFFSSLYWLSIALTFDENLKILIPISLILIPSFLAIFYGLALYLFSFFINLNNISLSLIFSLKFAIFEFIRGTILTGFPWNLFVFSFSKNLIFIQFLSVIGTYGFNMICITFFLIPAMLILRKSNKEIYFSLFFIFIAISFVVYGNQKLNHKNLSLTEKKNFLIKIVSPQINIDRFYNIDGEEKIIKDLIKLSKPNLNISTLFIWPEGVISSTDLMDIGRYKDLFTENFSEKHLIIMGINDSKNENEEKKIYNSLAVVNHNLELINVYHKNNLVPFGEFLPFENYLNKLGLRSITYGYQSFSKGQQRKIIKLKNDIFNLNFLPLICYEIIYSGKLSKNSNYGFIINISEDGWFGNSIGLDQHFSHSIFRAIEEGKNIIRSTNNGISAYINSNGKVISKLESTQGGVIVIDKFEYPKNSYFFKKGNKMFFYLLIIYIIFIFFINKFVKEDT